MFVVLFNNVALILSSLVLILGVSSAQAQPLALPQYVAGEHYQVLSNPNKLTAEDKIEVMEVYWYGCSHCLAFEPVINAWKKSLASDVVFARTPAMWGRKNSPTHNAMQSHAVLYYVAESLELPDAIHSDIFQILVKNPRLNDAKKFAEIFAKYGVDRDAFNARFESFGIRSKVNKAEKRISSNYRTQGTPEMVVNGRYRISARMAGSQQEMLQVVDFLIEQERVRTATLSNTQKESAKVISTPTNELESAATSP